MNKKILLPGAIASMTLTTAAWGHAGPRIWFDIQNSTVLTYGGPYPPDGVVADYPPSRVFSVLLPLSLDDDPLNFSTEFPGYQQYPWSTLPSSTDFTYNIMGEVQWYTPGTSGQPGTFEAISKAFPTQTPFIAVTNDIGNTQFSSTGFVAGDLTTSTDGDPTDHHHLTYTICTPEDLADGFDPEDAPAGVYAIPLQLTSPSASVPSKTYYVLLGDNVRQDELNAAGTVANSTLLNVPLTWTNASSTGDGKTWDYTTLNWAASASPMVYTDGNSITFNDSNNRNYNVSIAMTVTPASTTVAAIGNYTFTGTGGIGGIGGLNKTLSGTLTLSTTNTYTGPTNISSGTLILASAGALPSGTALTIGNGAAVLSADLNATIVLGSLNLTTTSNISTGRLDLANNKLVVHTGDLAALTQAIGQGFNGGQWNGSAGVTSTDASSNTTHLTALGVIQNSVSGNASGNALYTTFGNATGLTSSDILVKYTYYGDANLDGKVDGSDYSRIDNGFLTHATGWFNGDFNYDGVINGSDYTLIDNAFNTKGAIITDSIGSPVASITSELYPSAASVPEPSQIGLAICAVAWLSSRRKRKIASLVR